MVAVSDRRGLRHRTYSLVTLGLTCVALVVGLAAGLHLYRQRIAETFYKSPSRTLGLLASAQHRYRYFDLDADGRREYAPSLQALGEAGAITRKLATGQVGRYRYEVLRADGAGYAIAASPAELSSATDLFFYVDQTQIVRARVGAPADAAARVYMHPHEGRVWAGGGESGEQE